MGALPRAHLPKEHKEDLTMAKTKFKLNLTQIIGIVCLALMIALLVTQFLPYWTIGEDTTLSISEYTWFNYKKEYKSFINEMKTQLVDAQLMSADEEALKKLVINDFVYPPVFLLLVSAFGIVFSAIKLGKPLGMGFSLAVGCIGIWMYTSHPIYQLGANWQLHFGLSIALTALAALNIIIGLVKLFNDNYEIVYTPAKKK